MRLWYNSQLFRWDLSKLNTNSFASIQFVCIFGFSYFEQTNDESKILALLDCANICAAHSRVQGKIDECGIIASQMVKYLPDVCNVYSSRSRIRRYSLESVNIWGYGWNLLPSHLLNTIKHLTHCQFSLNLKLIDYFIFLLLTTNREQLICNLQLMPKMV